MIGRTLSHYKVLEELSRGGMRIVYHALDLKLNPEVAIEELPKLVTNPDRKQRFVKKAKVAAKLEHPRIDVIPVYNLRSGPKFDDLPRRVNLPT